MTSKFKGGIANERMRRVPIENGNVCGSLAPKERRH